jgi:integrase
MSISPLSRMPDSQLPSLAQVAEQIAADESLTRRQQQEMCSALRTVGRAIGRRLEEIPANLRQLRERLAAITPAMAGVSHGRWNNALSLTRGALKHVGLATIPGRSTEPLRPEWQDLFRHLNDRRLREGLSRFARFCGSRGIPPLEVDDTVATAFLGALENDGIIRKPRQVHRTMCISWNRAANTLATWPQSRLIVPQYKQRYSLDWDDFPRPLAIEAAAYFERLAGKDLLAELDFRPLRPTSIDTYGRLLRAYLSALVHRGRDPQSLRSLSVIVEVGTVKDGLRFFLDRAGGNKTKQAYNIARMLTALARHWVKVDANHLEKLRKICSALEMRQKGLTAKNRDRLRQFDDRSNVQALITLPQRNVRDDLSRTAALEVQSALAVELLLMIPMRIGNLASLDLEHNIVRTRARGRGVVFLTVPAEQVKNSFAIEAALPEETVRLLDVYVERYRPVLLKHPSSSLFPNSSGGPKSRHTLGLQISKFVRRECGLRVNPHLFRHIGAKLYLDAHPGGYGVIRLVHGHSSVDTTTRSYCDTNNAAAIRHFDENVLRLRAQARVIPKRNLRRAR